MSCSHKAPTNTLPGTEENENMLEQMLVCHHLVLSALNATAALRQIDDQILAESTLLF